MPRPTISFSDILTKQLIQNWGDSANLDAEQTLVTHFEERFEVKTIVVESARDGGENLFLKVVTDQWSIPREYALSRKGSLIW